jgi:hypothetical protein
MILVMYNFITNIFIDINMDIVLYLVKLKKD